MAMILIQRILQIPYQRKQKSLRSFLVGKMAERFLKEQEEVEDTNHFFMGFVRYLSKETEAGY